MREIRLSGSEGGGTGNSTGPPYPYPTSTVVGGRNWPWPRWWGGCGGWWWWRTLERPGWRSHAGAWERSEGSARSAWGDDRRAKWCARRTLRWGGCGVQGAAGWGRAGAGCWANRNGPAAEAAGPGGTLASGGVIRLGFCGDGPRRPDRPDRCRRAAWWRVRERGLPRCLHGP